MSDNYRPITCARYDELELAIMRVRRLRAAWRDDDGAQHVQSILPLDLQTLKRAEYLVYEAADGEQQQVRLDRLIRFESLRRE